MDNFTIAFKNPSMVIAPEAILSIFAGARGISWEHSLNGEVSGTFHEEDTGVTPT